MLNLTDWFEIDDIKRYRPYVVGGTVRDILMGQVPKDIDVVCKKAKELALKIAKNRNTAFVPMEKKPEEPCYRLIKRDNPEYFLDITELKGNSIYEDINNRDFTINAIALEIKDDGTLGNIIDPLNGIDDIKKKIIKITNINAFVNDPLRILRAFRFSSMLNFSIAQETFREIHEKAHLLKNISPERIMYEILLILKHENSNIYFRQMDESGVLEVIFPEILPMKGCPQNRYHHLDVWQHSLLTMEKCEYVINNLQDFVGDKSGEVQIYLKKDRNLQLLKLASLLHDIGKPMTYSKNADAGRITFHRHSEKGAEIIQEMAKRLKLSNKDTSYIYFLVGNHLNILNLYSDKKSKFEMIKWIKGLSDHIIPIIILSIADVLSALGPESSEIKRRGYIRWASNLLISYLDELKPRFESKPIITGEDLLSEGIQEGPLIGKILQEVRILQDAGEIKSREAALELIKKIYKDYLNK
jgi:putative nucleotidyltransferase with HDIG domain